MPRPPVFASLSSSGHKCRPASHSRTSGNTRFCFACLTDHITSQNKTRLLLAKNMRRKGLGQADDSVGHVGLAGKEDWSLSVQQRCQCLLCAGYSQVSASEKSRKIMNGTVLPKQQGVYVRTVGGCREARWLCVQKSMGEG